MSVPDAVALVARPVAAAKRAIIIAGCTGPGRVHEIVFHPRLPAVARTRAIAAGKHG